MRTSTFFKPAFVAVCVSALCFTSVKAEKIADPGGLEWNVLDVETEGKIPYINGGPDGDFLLKTSPWASQVTRIADNPNKTGLFNDSEKCVIWVKENVTHDWGSEGAWGSVGIEFTNGDNYWDLSAWEKVSVDIMIPGYDIYMYKLGFCLKDNNEFGGVEVWGLAEPQDEWNRLSINLNELINEAKVGVQLTPDTKINQIKIYVNGGAEDKMDIHIDNLRFTRTSEPSGIKENTVADFSIYPNPAVESIKIADVQGLVTIYNMLGTEMCRIADYNGENISVADFASGVYLVKYNGSIVKFTKK